MACIKGIIGAGGRIFGRNVKNCRIELILIGQKIILIVLRPGAIQHLGAIYLSCIYSAFVYISDMQVKCS